MDFPNKIRTFIALKPPETWIEQLARAVVELKTQLWSKEIKWVQPEQIHLTLRFIGYILPEQVPVVVERLNRAARSTEAFALRGGALGCFPSVRRARVFWLGVVGPEQRIVELQRRIAKETGDIGEPAEDRDFTAHLTVARIKHLERSQTTLLESVLKRAAPIFSEWAVSEVVLMQSHLWSTGARYELLHSAPFTGGKAGN